ncbi:uncharacterized protein BDZ99DRAFT_463905 [Mytilinidion resinicola]|uniref:Uncharacterized protein n=1 Tax=Mytilinidion resinicola TaxID=574789 RepID=A0A6A6YJR3_9PEZI|nr:uncharacterized protein BDZ99DRAFT_463905 [Mytilinidion resinicola]KAF2809092.1 hypothetical protein BDZ99DRAFT_463905 [Mytilinidion resinicola]
MTTTANTCAAALRASPTRAMSTTAVRNIKIQPWRQFWPPKAENFSEVQLQKMPWLAWKSDENNLKDAPWREWVLMNQSGIARRGSTTHFLELEKL